MPEEILFESEQQLDRDAVASYLRTIADRLEDGDPVSLESGADSLSVTVPPAVEFEVKVEREGPADGPTDIGFELEMEWDENASGERDERGGGLIIE